MRARFLRARGTSPYIGLPQRFCGAKDLWEECKGGKGKKGSLGIYSLSLAACSIGQQDSSPKRSL